MPTAEFGDQASWKDESAQKSLVQMIEEWTELPQWENIDVAQEAQFDN